MSNKGQGHSLTFAKSHSNSYRFFLNSVELIEIKYHVKDSGSTEMKICTHGLDHDKDGRHTHIW